jgi:hypothetical protein
MDDLEGGRCPFADKIADGKLILRWPMTLKMML